MSSFSLSGGVEIIGFISPTDTNDTYPVIDPLYGIDGFRNVNSLSDLNTIPGLRRRAGMVVGVGGGSSYYKLNYGPWNYTISDWSLFNVSTAVGDYLPLSGGTVTGDTIFTQGLTADTFSGNSIIVNTIDSTTNNLYDNSTSIKIDWENSLLKSSVGVDSVDWENSLLTDNSTNLSVNWNSRLLIDSSGSNKVDWESGVIDGMSNIYVNTLSATTYLNLPIDLTITGISYSSNTITITNNSGATLSTNINSFTGLTIYGPISATTISGNTFFGDGSNLTNTKDTYVTGGTYTNGSATFTNNTGGTFNVVGFYTGETSYVNSLTTGSGLSGSSTAGNITIVNTSPDQTVTISGGTGILTGGTYPNFTITNSSPDRTVTISGGTGIVTGGTYPNFTITNSAPDKTVTISNGQYITVTGTYPNFTIATTGITDNDKFTTGFTYNNNTFTLIDNSGNTLSSTINDVTGLTVNGDLTVTGNSYLNTVTASTITNVDYIDFDITQTGTTSSPGRLFWDVNNRTLSLGMLSGVTQQIGEEQYYLVENQTSGTLSDGTVVRAVGTTGSSGKILIDYMIANGTIPAFTTMGVLTQTLLSGETGYVTSFGLVRNIDTTGAPYGETWNQGDVLYVSTTILGGFTKFRPIVPNQDIIIAIVMEAAVNGSIFVRPDVYRPFKDPQLITVAKQNADFTSIKAAVDSIVGSSISNRYVIEVGPGIFVEDEIDLTSTPYVSIVGSNIQTTLVVPNTNTQHIIKIGINNEISFLSLSGASAGYAGIYCYDIGDFGQAHKISMYDCDTNIWIESDTQDTKFYGEYIDFNGEYTYGTKVIGNNGYLALANMENYFNFPTGGNITYCNFASGSGATLSVFVGDNQSNGISGSTAYLVRDGAGLYCSTITVDGFTYGIRNPNEGLPVRFDVDNASFVSGEWDLYVERIGTFGTFGGSSNHEKVFTVSEDVYWAFLDIEDGEFDITRKASVTFTDGSHTDFTTLIFEGSTMGLLSGGSLTTISGFTVQADGGFGYLEKSDDSGIVRRIDWLNNQITLSANTDNYIYINENSNLVSSGTRPITSYNILLGRVVTDSTGVEFIDLTPMNAEHTSNSFDSLFTMALGPIYATGSIVTEGVTPFTLDVSQGDYHFSTNVFLPSGGTGITFIQYYRNGTGTTWVTSATTLVNNTQYDNNGTLTGLTSGYFTKHTLYTVGQGSYENYFLVIGQDEYSTLVEAEDALLTTPPTYFTDGVVQIANIYIQEGTSGITQIEDIRPTIGFRAGGVNASSVHGNLLGLTADDHIQYLLVSGARAMSGNLDMGVNDITNVGTVDGVIVSSHASRHQFGGLDPVGSTTPSANAIPYADVSGTLDGWISTATTSNYGKVKTSSLSNTVISDDDSRFLSSFTGGTYSDTTKTLTLSTVDGTSYPITGFKDVFVTGGTYSNGTTTFTNNSGGTFNVSGFFTGGTDVFVTGGTYSSGTATFTNNTGGTFSVSGFSEGGVSGTTNQVAFFNTNSTVSGNNNLVYSGGTLQVTATGATVSATPLRLRNSANNDNIAAFNGNGAFKIGLENGYHISLTPSSPSLRGQNVGTVAWQLSPWTGEHSWLTNNATNQNLVGIGTTSPSDKLHVYNTINDYRIRVSVGAGTPSNESCGIKFTTTWAGTSFGGNAAEIVVRTKGSNTTTSQKSAIEFQLNSGGTTSVRGSITSQSNLLLQNPTEDTSDVGTIYVLNGVTPTASTTDGYKQYSADIVAGNAAPHFRTESGNIVKLYTHSAVTTTQGIADALTTLGLLSSSTITSSSSSGDYLPLSGGTVTGDTIFNNPITANTITTSALNGAGFPTAIEVDTYYMYDTSSFSSIDWANRLLYFPDGSTTSIDWGVGYMNATNGVTSLDWESARLTDTLTSTVSVDWKTRELKDSTNNVKYNWESGILTGATQIESSTISATTYQNLPTLTLKSDSVSAGSFTGNPKKYTVTFTTPYSTTNYTIGITGSDNRTFTYESKTTTGFVINTNANTSLTGNVDWQTIAIGES